MELWKRSWSTHRERKELLTAEVPSKGEGRSMGYKCAKMFAEIKVMVRQKKNTGIYFWTWEFFKYLLFVSTFHAPRMEQKGSWEICQGSWCHKMIKIIEPIWVSIYLTGIFWWDSISHDFAQAHSSHFSLGFRFSNSSASSHISEKKIVSLNHL